MSRNANSVSEWITDFTFAGFVPVQSGPASRKLPAPLPVARLPT